MLFGAGGTSLMEIDGASTGGHVCAFSVCRSAFVSTPIRSSALFSESPRLVRVSPDCPVEPSPIQRVDLCPDALACLRAAGHAGLAVGIAGNQPAGVEAQLREVGFKADFIASSAAWGVTKPSAEFFSRIVDTAQLDAGKILYVGDRLDNDVLPARKAGMRTAFVRHGPWGYLHAQRPEVELADMRIESLAELTMAFDRKLDAATSAHIP